MTPITSRNRSSGIYFGPVCWEYKEQFGYAQARPIDRVLPYYTRRFSLKELDNSQIDVGDALSTSHCPGYEPVLQNTINRAYSKLKGGITEAGIGVNIVEYRQARDMFTTRGGQVLTLLNLLRRGKFATAGKMIGANFFNAKPPRKRDKRARVALTDHAKNANISWSNLWLEWHFGVDPLIKDCQSAAKVLTEPPGNTKLQGSATEYVRQETSRYDAANPGTVRSDKWATRVQCRQGTEFAITSPNVALAGQLGLLNPAALLWEIVPFSFVLDWFVNVGDWLQGFSDFAGMTLQRAYTTIHLWTFQTHTEVLVPWNAGVVYRGKRFASLIELNRDLGLTTPILSVRPLKLPSIARAATAWSLVSQIVQRHR